MSNKNISSTGNSCCQGSCGSDPAPKHIQLIPEDKNLSPQWLESLYQRGEPEVYNGDNLKHIGMPVSGICTGQVYLSGDGQLWHWDVFKTMAGTDELIDPRGHHYKSPITVKSPIDQGFSLNIHSNGSSTARRLDASGFSNVSFEGRYPIGYVNFSDDNCPVEVNLQAYSPFIPLDEDNSGLPVTVMEYTIKNTSDESVSLDIAGWLENQVCHYDDEEGKGIRRNDVSNSHNALMLACHADAVEDTDLSSLFANGNMTLALLDSENDDKSCPLVDGLLDALVDGEIATESAVFSQLNSQLNSQLSSQLSTQSETRSASQPFGHKTVGALGREISLAPGEEKTVRFAISWYFPAYCSGYVFHSTMEDIPNLEQIKRFYAKQFDSSEAVIGHLANNFTELSDNTKLWVDTWYDSTLPYWFLNRTFINTSTLATQTCHRFDDGRFYAWEGVDCCPGTCQHVWHYAQAVARIFPGLERNVREFVDYGIAYGEDGSLGYRAEASDQTGDIVMVSENESENFFAADGQLGTIIRVYREHTMSADNAFLTRIWPKVKKSLQFMTTLDTNEFGLVDTAQFHTLDTSWHGEIPWISSLYLAALAAGKKMAEEMGDKVFAQECTQRLEVGSKNIVEHLYNGEYFVHKPDAAHPDSMDLTQGSYIDQVFGQGYAHQVGLERVIPKEQSVSALSALWKYNFAPDVGPYREGFNEVDGGRWYAMPGEGGLLMCTWPKDDCNRSEYEQTLLGLDVTSEGYLNECMSGFEYQVASHMIAEGLVEEGLALTRTVHDRYHPSKRNPWNEVECSDHYSRAMASYGVYISSCGFDYHGPDARLSFSPKITPENFRSAFTVAQGWGTFSQVIQSSNVTASIHLKYGQLVLKILGLTCDCDTTNMYATLNNTVINVELIQSKDNAFTIVFDKEMTMFAGDVLQITTEK